jgi:hypothetical protein
MMENTSWSDIANNSDAHYINNTLVPMAALDTMDSTSIHPSLPNYIWMEAGSNLGITTDTAPVDSLTTTSHLTDLIKSQAHDSWKAYAEDISGQGCPLTSQGNFATKHNPMLYFTDVASNTAYCQSHERPFTELAGDLQNNTLPAYSFIEPNLCDDMHGGVAQCPNPIQSGDAFLSRTVPMIINSSVYKQTAIIVAWDEGSESFLGNAEDGPLGEIVVSPCAKAGTYTTPYSHSSTLRTIEEILKVTPLLGKAAIAPDLSNMFKSQC